MKCAGLTSEVVFLDNDSRAQIEALRDNFHKLCRYRVVMLKGFVVGVLSGEFEVAKRENVMPR